MQLSTGGEDGDLSNIICILEAVYTVLDRESDFVACILCSISVYRLAAAACSRRICRQGAPVPFLSTSTGTEGGPETWDDCLRINRPLSMPPGDGFEGAGSPLARTHTGTPYQKGCIHAHTQSLTPFDPADPTIVNAASPFEPTPTTLLNLSAEPHRPPFFPFARTHRYLYSLSAVKPGLGRYAS